MKKKIIIILTILIISITSCASKDNTETTINDEQLSVNTSTNEEISGILKDYNSIMSTNDLEYSSQEDLQNTQYIFGEDTITNTYTASIERGKDENGNIIVKQDIISEDNYGKEERQVFYKDDYIYFNDNVKEKYPTTFLEFSQNFLLTSTLTFEEADIINAIWEKNNDEIIYTFYIDIKAPYFNDLLGSNSNVLSQFFSVDAEIIKLTASDVKYEVNFDLDNKIKEFKLNYDLNLAENKMYGIPQSSISLDCLTTINLLEPSYEVELPEDLDSYEEG
ncbi:MAG: hypothetical protein ACK5LY_02840 [Lachnospirales bacterium]